MMLLARWMTRPERPHEHSSSFVFYMLAGQAAVGWLVAAPTWRTPDGRALAQMAAMGVFAILGNYGLAEAFRTAPVAVVAPFEYTGVIWAVLLGALGLRGDPGADVLGGRRHHHRRRPLHAAPEGALLGRGPRSRPEARKKVTETGAPSSMGGPAEVRRPVLASMAKTTTWSDRWLPATSQRPAGIDAEPARRLPAGGDVLDQGQLAAGRVAREHRDVVRAALRRVDEAAARVGEDLRPAVGGGDGRSRGQGGDVLVFGQPRPCRT